MRYYQVVLMLTLYLQTWLIYTRSHTIHVINHWLIVISGIRLLGNGSMTDIVEASSLTHKNDIIDVYSNSWGPPDTGITAGKMGMLVEMAMEKGTTKVNHCDISQT